MSKVLCVSREIKTKNMFQSERSQSGGIIYVSKSHLFRSLCLKTLKEEVSKRPGFELVEYGSFYIVLCNSGTGTKVDTSLAA